MMDARARLASFKRRALALDLPAFRRLADAGRLHRRDGSGVPPCERTPLAIGCSCGFSFADIAHFYARRRGAFHGRAFPPGYDPCAAGLEELKRDAS